MSKFQDVARESLASSHWKWISQPAEGVRNEIRRTRKIRWVFDERSILPVSTERLKIELDGIFSGHFYASLNWFPIFSSFLRMMIISESMKFDFKSAMQKILIRRWSVKCQLWWASNRQSTLLINDGELSRRSDSHAGWEKKGFYSALSEVEIFFLLKILYLNLEIHRLVRRMRVISYSHNPEASYRMLWRWHWSCVTHV